MSLVAAQNCSHCNGVWESRRFLAVLLTAKCWHAASCQPFNQSILSRLCIVYYSYVRCAGEVMATRGQFSRDVFLDVERVVYWNNPKERSRGLWDIKKDLDIKFNARDGRVSTCFLDEYIITKSTSISLPSPGQVADRYQTSQLSRQVILLSSFWELRLIRAIVL